MTQPLDLEALVQAHLAAGGTIQEVPPGATGLQRMSYRQSMSMLDLRAKHPRTAPRLTKVRKRQLQDQRDKARLDEALNRQWTTYKALAAELEISEYRLKRLVELHFHRDPRTRELTKRSLQLRDQELEKRVLPLLKRAMKKGVRGSQALTAATGVDWKTLLRLAARHQLTLPKLPTGRKKG
jgi:hypothetical protein